jgi:hypothetical protein
VGDHCGERDGRTWIHFFRGACDTAFLNGCCVVLFDGRRKYDVYCLDLPLHATGLLHRWALNVVRIRYYPLGCDEGCVSSCWHIEKSHMLVAWRMFATRFGGCFCFSPCWFLCLYWFELKCWIDDKACPQSPSVRSF